MLQRMARVQIIGSRGQLDSTVAAIHRLGVLQVEDVSKARSLKELKPDEHQARLQEDLAFLATRLDALIQILPVPEPETTKLPSSLPNGSGEPVAVVRAQLDKLAPEIQELAKRRDALQAELMALPRYEITLKKLAPLAVELRELQGFETTALLIDRPYRDVLEVIRSEVERIAGAQCEVVAREVDDQTTAALLLYPRSVAQEVQALLGQENITQVRLPKEIAGRSFRDALSALEDRKQSTEREIAGIETRLMQIAGRWRLWLEAHRFEVRNRLQRLLIRTRFGSTTHTFVMEGWVPRNKVSALGETLAREVGQELLVKEMALTRGEREKAPVAFVNPRPLKPFEMLVRLSGLPRYSGFDPTPVIAVFLPLFFGIILGDVGYGLILLVVAIDVRRRYAANQVIRDLAQIFIYGAVWAVAFGFMYGEFLGTLGERIGLRPLWMPREGEKILALFAFCIALGVFQVLLGLMLGAWQAWRERQRSELISKISMLVTLAAIFGLIGVATHFLPGSFFTPTIVLLLIGLVVLIIPAGPVGVLLGPLEVLETVGNMLSYLRLAAIGLASVYLAMVANRMAGLVGNVLVGVILAALLHALNFALSVLSPAIQSLRLQYVEFFRQFHHGGGHEYKPFKVER
ncbi:MAG: hypothetical protein HY650_13575 [Acidobacteria bacterium]|nr:hypothetical protein [Acidobacteriota bacterium]